MLRVKIFHDTRTEITNQKMSRIKRSTEIKDVRSLPNFNRILSENPYCKHVRGWYVEIPLAHYKTFVPDSRKFPDREDHFFDANTSQNKKFDASLLSLRQWHDKWNQGHPHSDTPELLANANWYNIWPNDIPNQR